MENHSIIIMFASWIVNVVFSSGTPAECKLSRPGPPATIVTIDEESTNGTFQSAAPLPAGLSLLRIVPFAPRRQTLFFLRSSGVNSTVGTASAARCFHNAIHINTSPRLGGGSLFRLKRSGAAEPAALGAVGYRRCFVRPIGFPHFDFDFK